MDGHRFDGLTRALAGESCWPPGRTGFGAGTRGARGASASGLTAGRVPRRQAARDSDGDGLSDGFETARTTSPLTRDTTATASTAAPRPGAA